MRCERFCLSKEDSEYHSQPVSHDIKCDETTLQREKWCGVTHILFAKGWHIIRLLSKQNCTITHMLLVMRMWWDEIACRERDNSHSVQCDSLEFPSRSNAISHPLVDYLLDHFVKDFSKWPTSYWSYKAISRGLGKCTLTYILLVMQIATLMLGLRPSHNPSLTEERKNRDESIKVVITT